MSDRFRFGKWGWLIGVLALMAMVPAVMPPAATEYRFPMAGMDFQLAGTFGELRSNHFHSGIDVKTNGGIGQPLFAVRDGYVYRIKVSPFGFGKAIYLRHADGEFSVYGHMNGFTPAIEEYVYQKQYTTKQYEQEIYLDEGLMPVRAGDLIGFSGNSGYSHGPHLHFEIRDPEERITNPLFHYRNLVSDHKRPEIVGIAWEPMGVDSRINGLYQKLEMKPTGGNGDYSIPGIVQLRGPVGLEYDAFDQLDAAPNSCGINYARLYLDGQLIYDFALDRFSFDDKRYINVHFDYAHFKETGRRYQRSYIEPGNRLDCFPQPALTGMIALQDDAVHDLRLELADGYRNITNLRAQVQRSPEAVLPAIANGGEGQTFKTSTHRHVCMVRLGRPVTRQLGGLDVVHRDGSTSKLAPAYLQGDELVYLLDLAQPNSPVMVHDPLAGHKEEFFVRDLVLPNQDNLVTEGEVQVYLPEGCVFDKLPLHIRRKKGGQGSLSDFYEIGHSDEPVFKSFVVSFAATPGLDATRLVVARKQGGVWTYVGGELREDRRIVASSGDFGTFCLMADSVSPRIKPANFTDGATISAKQQNLSLTITDEFSGINNQKILGTIDGRWELFEYDAKASTIRHTWRQRPTAGAHTLQVMVWDNAGNLAQGSWQLIF